ncbi:MAG: signal peptide peptidase SppA [Verrucomicrobia bacterium]|nr:signal peptide peptidase SppA [Verrucomicrobiota bacterium]
MRTLLRTIWKLMKVAVFTIGIMVVLGLLLAIAVAILAPSGPKIEDKSVLVFNLNTQITDRPADERAAMLARLLGDRGATLQLRAATTALREAAQDKRISGLYLYGSLIPSGYSSGYGALKELRESIQDFQKSGKPVIAYIADADNRDYYVMSVANQILLNPLGGLAFRGLAAHGTFFKGAGDKYGIEFTPIRHGKYKSAIEPFTRENFSPENREQIQALIQTVWGEMLTAVATSRKIPTEQLQALVDTNGLIDIRTAKAAGLVTEAAYEAEAFDKLRQLTGTTAKDKQFPQVSLAQYAPVAQAAAARKHQGKDKIAIVYAEGAIVDGEGDPSSQSQVAGEAFARLLRKVQERKDVKAVVLRVNSPGGSAEASDVILDELRRFKSNRPVIVSMGTVAASGGYFISMAARRILAEPSTITGSIGVFGLGLNLKKLANDHGVTFDALQTGALADLGTLTRPMNPEEQAVIQKQVDYIYDEFVQRVARCRMLPTNRVDEIAQGRVWSGADALKIGLVDELGGLDRAIAVAAKEAKVGADYGVIEFPETKSLLEELSEAFGGEQPPLAKNNLGSRIADKVMTNWRWLSSFNDPHGIYARLPFELELN